MMNDSLFRQNGCLRLLHEGIPPAPDSVWPALGVPPLPAEPFSPAALTASAFWPQELPSPVFSSPHPDPDPDPDPDPEDHPSQKPYPFLNISLPSDGTPEKTGLAAPLYLCGSATSSMDVARSLIAADQLPVWGSVLALQQSSGRGQLGRSWVSPQGNVYAALRLPLCPPFSETAAAPAMGGLLAEALAGLGFPTHMKWPNDLLQKHDGVWRKVGGILLEERGARGFGKTSQRTQRGAPASLVAGIGLNLHSCPPDALLRAQRAVSAGCLTHENGFLWAGSPLTLWARLVSRLFICYVEQIHGKEDGAWREIAERRLAFAGQTVIVIDGPGDNDCQRGVLEGLDRSGGLRLRNGTDFTLFHSGSLQLA